MKGRVLVVDDDLALAEMLSIVLRQEGLDVSHVADGSAAVQAFRDYRPDLVLLDVMLPGLDGMEVCRRIRAESGVPIVMLTARTDTVDIVVGLESGADDYIIKPFKPQELIARVRARLRRGDEPEPEKLEIGDLADRRRRPLGQAGRRAPCRSRRWSSTCSSRSPASPGRSSPVRSCSSRSGATATPATPGSSTSTSSGCAARSRRTRSTPRSS